MGLFHFQGERPKERGHQEIGSYENNEGKNEKKEMSLRQKGHDKKGLFYEWIDHNTCNHDEQTDIPRRHMERSEVVVCEY